MKQPGPSSDDAGAARYDPPGDFLDVLLCEPPQAPQLHAVGLAVLGGLDRGEERRLARAAASSLACAALAAEVGIVHLDAAVERLVLVALQHHLPELVVPRPGGVVADVEAPWQLERRDTLLGLRQVEHGAEPTPSDRAWSPRRSCLLSATSGSAAGIALPQGTLLQFMMRRTPAGRTREALRPTPGEKRLAAFSSVPLQPIQTPRRRTSLKLHLVLCNVLFP